MAQVLCTDSTCSNWSTTAILRAKNLIYNSIVAAELLIYLAWYLKRLSLFKKVRVEKVDRFLVLRKLLIHCLLLIDSLT